MVAPRSPGGCVKIFYFIFFNLLNFYPITCFLVTPLLVTALLCLVTPDCSLCLDLAMTKPVMPTLPLLAGDLRFFALSPAFF